MRFLIVIVLSLGAASARAERHVLHAAEFQARIFHPFRVLVLSSSQVSGSLTLGSDAVLELTLESDSLRAQDPRLQPLVHRALQFEKHRQIRFASRAGQVEGGRVAQLRLQGDLAMVGDVREIELLLSCVIEKGSAGCSTLMPLPLSSLPIVAPTLVGIPANDRMEISATLGFKQEGG